MVGLLSPNFGSVPIYTFNLACYVLQQGDTRFTISKFVSVWYTYDDDGHNRNEKLLIWIPIQKQGIVFQIIISWKQIFYH